MSEKVELSRQQRKSQETREKIFQAAKKILQKKGYEELSIKNICEEAGVSNGSFYHHFKTKDDLLSYYIEEQPTINPDLLVLSLVLTAAVSVLAIRDLRALDVVALGPDIATALGVDHRRISRRVMVMVAVLVSVSTALVGPIMFLGLLVAHLAYWAAGTNRHVVTVPMAALVAMLVLVTGQTVLAHVLDADNVLSVIIEFLGGLTLIALIISSRRRS